MRFNHFACASIICGAVITVGASSATVRAQYSAVIAQRPPASVTIGSYSAALQQRAAQQVSYRHGHSHYGHSHSGHSHYGHAHHGHAHHGHRQHGHYHRSYQPYYAGFSNSLYVNNLVGYGGYYGSPYNYAPYNYGYGYGVNYAPYYLGTGSGTFGPYVLPPIYVPAEQLGYGPQAVRSFMGLDPVSRPAINRTIVIAPPQHANPAVLNGAALNGAAVVAKPAVRVSNAESRARSAKFIEFGDAQFAAIRPLDALDRYKKAAEAAPDMLEPHFRQGFILAHMQRYDQAARAFRRGLELRPATVEPNVSILQLYGDNRAARESLLARMKIAAADPSANADVQLTAGLLYYFDSQPDAAHAAFRQAQRLGEPAQYVEPLLQQLGEPKVPEQPAVELDI